MANPLEDTYRKVARASGGACLIAVSKKQTLEAIEALYRLGHRDFGENYAQELVEKAEALAARGLRDLRWHFIGHLQTNKAKAILPWVAAVHSVDSLKLASELSKRWSALGRGEKLPVFIEVNIDSEPAKAGVMPAETRALCERIAAECPALALQGLMCIPSAEGDSRGAFVRLRDLEASCRPFTQGKLSMGMSSDFEVAVAEGATHVRVGTLLFGARPSA